MADNKFLAEIVNQAIEKGNKILEKSFAINENSREHLQAVLKLLENIKAKKNYSTNGSAILKLSDGIDALPSQPHDSLYRAGGKILDYMFKQKP